MVLYLNEIIWDVPGEDAIDGRTVPLPDNVHAANLLSYLTDRYDTEPLDVVTSDLPDSGPTAVGWSFPLGQGQSDDDPAGRELLAVPMIRVDDGELVPLFAKLAEDRANLERIAETTGGPLHVVQIEQEEWRPDASGRGRELAAAATRASQAGDYEEAERLLDQAERHLREVDAHALADVLYDRGFLDLARGDPPAARDRFEEAARLYRDTGHGDELWARVAMANALSDLGRYDDALSTYADARERLVERQDVGGLATIEMEIGLTLSRTGQPQAAREHYERALAGYREHGSAVDVARCLQNLGSTLKDLGETERAIEAHRDARAIYEGHGMGRHVVDCDVNIANVHWHLGRLRDAADTFERVRSLYEELGLPTEAADCDDSLGALLTELGQPEEAVDLHRRALDAYRTHGELPVQAAICERNLGHALDHLGEHEDARRHIASAREVFDQAGADDEVSECDLYLAHVASSQGDTGGALELVAQARRIWERARPGEAAPGCDLTAGEVLVAAGRHGDAIAPLERAEGTYADAGNPHGQAESALTLARALADGGGTDAAARAVERARELFANMGADHRVDECDEVRDRLS